MNGVSLDGELLLVTGGDQGLGAATSLLLTAAGALAKLQNPETVAETIKHVLLPPPCTASAEVMLLPTQESSWP